MDNLPTVPIVITAVLIFIIILLATMYWCCDRSEGKTADRNEVQCLRLQIKSDSENDPQWISVFEIDEDQPPPYEFPPAYKNIYLMNTADMIT